MDTHRDAARRTPLLEILELGARVRLVRVWRKALELGVLRPQAEPRVRVRTPLWVDVVRQMHVLQVGSGQRCIDCGRAG